MSPDLLELYRWAVQDPETQVEVLRRMYAQIRGEPRPRVLREDFAGASSESIAWVAKDAARRAVAVDLDAEALAWAKARANKLLGGRAHQIEFVQGDVVDVAPPAVSAADVISVLNFSIGYFHARDALLRYLRHARACLSDGGLLVFNLFGGRGAMQPSVDRHRVTPVARAPGETPPAPFDYAWEQRDYDPLTGRIDCRIHFTLDGETPGGERQEIKDAFTYDWRLWSPAEAIDAVREAGFADAQLWRHTYDPALGRNGVFLGPVSHLRNAPATWTAYVVGVR